MRTVPQDDLDRCVELIESAIGVIRSRDGIQIAPEMAHERARNACQAIVGEFELRRIGGPLLVTVGPDQVLRVDHHGPHEDADTEVARLSLFQQTASLALTAGEARALADGLTPRQGLLR